MKVLDAFKNSFRLLADRIMKPWLHINAIYKLTTHHTELMGYMNTIESFILKVSLYSKCFYYLTSLRWKNGYLI